VVDVAVPPTPTEEKTVNITDNGTTVVTPTFGSNLSKVTVNVNVSTPLDDPNLTFQTVLSTNNMILRVDTYNSDIQTRMLYLYKIRIGYTISPTSTSTDINNRLADLYVCIAFDETESIMKISCIPVKNVSSEGSITIVSTSNDITISNYLANLTFFTATSSRGYARSVNLNNVELIYTKKL
jgi:hypothetical protein